MQRRLQSDGRLEVGVGAIGRVCKPETLWCARGWRRSNIAYRLPSIPGRSNALQCQAIQGAPCLS